MKKYPLTLAGSIQLLKDSLSDETVSNSLKCAIIIALNNLPKLPEPPKTLQIVGEEWRDIPDSHGEYQGSTFGRIKSLKGGKELIMKPQMFGRYYVISLWIDGKRINSSVHRLIAKTFLPNPDNLPEVDHIDKDPTNNRVDNLQWVTRNENVRRAYQTFNKVF